MSEEISGDRILNIFQAIKNSKVTNKTDYFASKYENFKNKYPKLYEMACNSESIDIDNLKFMISMLKQMQNNTVSQFDASASVGQFLYDKYIHDNIKDLPPTKK